MSSNPVSPQSMEKRTSLARATAVQFCTHLHTRSFSEAAKLFGPSADWLVVASPPDGSWGGSVPGPTMCASAADLLQTFEEWSFSVQNVIADGEHVVVDGIARGRGPGKVRYDNNYLMLFTVRNGQIMDFKECLDAYQVERWFETRREAGLL